MRFGTIFFLLIVFVAFSCNEEKNLHGKIHVNDFQIDFKDCTTDDMGNAYFTGYIEPDYFKKGIIPPEWLKGCDQSSMVLYKIGPNGEQLLLERFSEVSVGNAILVTENNDVVVVGYYFGNDGPFTEEGRFIDVTLTRFNAEGKKLWSKVIYSGYETEGLEVVEINNEFYVLTKEPDFADNKAVIVKVSAQGEVISQKRLEHNRGIYPYQMVEKSGKIFITAHIGGNGVVIQVNPETGAINKSFGWDMMLRFPSIAVHPEGIVTLYEGNDYWPIIIFDEELNEIRRDSLKFDYHSGGYIQICSDPKGATYILSATKNNKMELIKFNIKLEQLWRKEIEDTPDFKIGEITVTPEGNILTSGRVGTLYMNGDGYYSTFTPDGQVY